MLTLNDGRSELWQWDTGRKLTVDADCSQVHFSNKVFGRSIDVDVVGGVAIIPDILLQTDKDLNVWAFVGTAENGYTKISKTFKVNRRNKPADYVFTQTDQMTLQTIQRQIGDLADLTTEAKDTLVTAINEAAKSGGGGSGIVIDSTLTKSGQAADAAAVGARLSSLSEDKVNLPKDESGAAQNGTNGQILQTNGDGTTQWVDKPQGGGGGIALGITGATVGQIAKITAVDKNGKPTAWEAADVGGWDLISDITLTEDGGGGDSLDVTRNDKGEYFEYRQCMVCISGTVIDGWPKGANQYIYLYENNNATGISTAIMLSRLAPGEGGTTYKTTIEMSIFGNLVRTIACGGTADTSSLILRNDSSIDTFRSIKLSCYGNNQWVSVPLAAGGRVAIYGRK